MDSAELMTPLWQRIAEGSVDLSQYSDEEILSGKIQMPDGRVIPQPRSLPDTFLAEQVRRGFRKAQRLIRTGAMDALRVYSEILNDDMVDPKDRIRAGQFFLNRFLGKETQHVHVTTHDGDSAREELVRRLVAARAGLPVAAALELASTGHVTDEVVDAELVDEANIYLEDLL